MTTDRDVQTTPCPPWCEQVQCREDDPADRYHQRLVVIPVVYRVSAGTVEAADLAIVRFTSATSQDDDWIGLDLGEGAASITLSRESADRLLGQLEPLLRDRET